ncbi:hypothetical protein GGTG_00742 [Gaeumannomyces tritici R3-111a-1]|uniref:Uncharacterized protein n=1 Tax=Gaeumannomyces tritici (strain R3-111a-1) TaxID=644352 RepID=J3NHK5_GAET3|nr:hypothetical protein GGTG_00742 [Gaeumannomyces tritici R3-111a-1]EJT80748.1 hypothetical protein GGTG_00742 [Gaeumannomyces tritici R3-111a-1]
MGDTSIAGPEGTLFGAIGAVLGYIGAEAVMVQSIEQLLWPQRSFSHFTFASLPKLALLLPMGGPLHKAALLMLDSASEHGLFRGKNLGHMLGTPFFPHLAWTYTVHGNDGAAKSGPQSLRNCLWARAISRLPTPTLDDAKHSGLGPNSGSAAEEGVTARRPAAPVRSMVAVSHLTLARPTAADLASGNLPFVSEGTGSPNLRVILALVATEFSALLVAVGVAAAFRTAWALLWVAPLMLRLASAFLALRREPLESLAAVAPDAPVRDFEVHCPTQSGSGFLLITGAPAVVNQFMLHYGHPVRSRPRELAQFAIVVALGLFFPVSLFCSLLWMQPAELQYVWLCYQLYVVLAMYTARYATDARDAADTATRLARCFGAGGGQGALLFGHRRGGARTVKASLAVTYHLRYADGQERMAELLRRIDPVVLAPSKALVTVAHSPSPSASNSG